MTVAGAGARGDEGALAAVLPAAARTLWVDDEGLAGDLVGGGYDVTTDVTTGVSTGSTDVAVLTGAAGLEAAPPADVVIVLLDGTRRSALTGRLHDAAARLRAHARVRAQAREAERQLRGQGHRQVCVLSWDEGVPLASRAAPGAARSPARPESYPRRVVLVAGEPDGPTVLDRALEQAGCRPPVEPTGGLRATVSPGGAALLRVDRGLLRVGLARGCHQVDTPASVLALLALPTSGAEVSRRTPDLIGRGRAGGASWSLEQWMQGAPARPPLAGPLLEDCVDFLVALHPVPSGQPRQGPELRAAAADVERLSARPEAVRRLAQRAEDALQELPRGFAHGDFWHRNLLVDQGRLTGVVDWDSARAGTLPFLDLMHLRATQSLRPGGHSWGRALVESLLPWAERGGDRHAERYAAALGVPVDAGTLRALVTGYWLTWLDYQLTHYELRRQEPRWVRGNIDLVVAALSGQR
jgi:hypothetical protein